jgi:hypothetical protein
MCWALQASGPGELLETWQSFSNTVAMNMFFLQSVAHGTSGPLVSAADRLSDQLSSGGVITVVTITMATIAE